MRGGRGAGVRLCARAGGVKLADESPASGCVPFEHGGARGGKSADLGTAAEEFSGDPLQRGQVADERGIVIPSGDPCDDGIGWIVGFQALDAREATGRVEAFVQDRGGLRGPSLAAVKNLAGMQAGRLELRRDIRDVAATLFGERAVGVDGFIDRLAVADQAEAHAIA